MGIVLLVFGGLFFWLTRRAWERFFDITSELDGALIELAHLPKKDQT